MRHFGFDMNSVGIKFYYCNCQTLAKGGDWQGVS